MEVNFESQPHPEEEIKSLEAQIKSLTETADKRSLELGIEKKQALSSVIREEIDRIAPGSPKNPAEGLPQYSSEIPMNVKSHVEQIVNTLWQDGDLVKAAKSVHGHGPLAMDLLHDVLIKLSEKMKERGIL